VNQQDVHQQRRAKRHEAQRMRRIDGDHRPGAPAQPFEEIVRVTRIAPQPDVAHRALICAGEAAQLAVGCGLSGDGDHQQGHAGDIGRGGEGGGVGRRQAHGQHQNHRGGGLNLQKDEEIGRP